MTSPKTPSPATVHRPLKGTRILSLALNLPGPAVLMRWACVEMTRLHSRLRGPQWPDASRSILPVARALRPDTCTAAYKRLSQRILAECLQH